MILWNFRQKFTHIFTSNLLHRWASDHEAAKYYTEISEDVWSKIDLFGYFVESRVGVHIHAKQQRHGVCIRKNEIEQKYLYPTRNAPQMGEWVTRRKNYSADDGATDFSMVLVII